MGNVVAARRLRKSMLREINADFNDPLPNFRDYDSYTRDLENVKSDEVQKKFKLSYKAKIILKIFFSTLIVFVCLVGKLLFFNEIQNNKYIMKIVNEYSNDYSKDYILKKLETFAYNISPYLDNIVPENIRDKVIEKYNNIKPQILEFELKEKIYSIIYPNQVVETISTNIEFEKDDEIKEIFSGIGGGEPIEIKNESSAVSMMQDDVSTILSKNINIMVPVNGTITSEFGARDEIFEGVNSYHTGIDIANAMGTEIKSATDGTVYNVQVMDKYYGNNIEIEKEGVIFKYAHLSEIKVNEGDEIKQGDIIGLMGSTGMSTGSHLHFEIIIDSRAVDPRKLVNF